MQLNAICCTEFVSFRFRQVEMRHHALRDTSYSCHHHPRLDHQLLRLILLLKRSSNSQSKGSVRNKTRSTVPSRSRHTHTHSKDTPSTSTPPFDWTQPHKRTSRGPATAKTALRRCNTLVVTIPSNNGASSACQHQTQATPHQTADPPTTPTHVRPAQRNELGHYTLAHADLILSKIHRKTSILPRPCHSPAAWRHQEPTTSQYAALLPTMPSIHTPILAVGGARRHGTASSLDRGTHPCSFP